MSDELEATVVQQLRAIGEDPDREGLRDTPRRYLKALREMTSGTAMDPKEPLARTFQEQHDEMVTVSDIDFVSVCEHHLLPFVGKAYFAYVPKGCIVGLSKIPRMIEILSRRLQVQERLAAQIADTFDVVLKPRGVMVVLKAQHSCMSCRGVRSNGRMVTSVVRGCFTDAAARAEALKLMGV